LQQNVQIKLQTNNGSKNLVKC